MSKNVKVLVFSAMCVALAFIASMIKLFHFPTGGSFTLCSMLFAALPGYFFGPAAGIVAGIAYGLLQFFVDPFVLAPVQVLLDYGAFAMLGLSGFFRGGKRGLEVGYLVGCLGRFLCSFLSGWVFFGEYAWAGWSPAAYSAAYNIIYIGAEAIVTVLILQIPAVRNALHKAGELVNR